MRRRAHRFPRSKADRLRFPFFVWVVALLMAGATPVSGYPPAPHFTVYGMVRDQWGYQLDVDDAFVVARSGDQEIARAAVVSLQRLDRNYGVKLPVDSGITERLYKTSALKPFTPFTLEVEADGQVFLPIEVSFGSLNLGQPGGSMEIDLTLGEDTDGDGLPDLWEQWQLSAAGINPGDPDFNLQRLNGQGDFDHDGMDNRAEYIAGTFALFTDDRFDLTIVAYRANGLVELEFLAIRDKVYNLERSTDLKNWEPISIHLNGSGDSGANAWVADDVTFKRVFAEGESADSYMYRMKVR